jgi:periplasmic copper chaperone A
MPKKNLAGCRSLALSLATLCAAPLTLTLMPATALAHEYYAGHLKLVHPWAQPSEPGDSEAFVYFSIEDISREDVLLRVSSPLAQSIDIRSGKASQATTLAEVKIPTGTTFEFLPDKTYLRLKGLTTPLKWGRNYAMTFHFKLAGPVNTMVSVGAH